MTRTSSEYYFQNPKEKANNKAGKDTKHERKELQKSWRDLLVLFYNFDNAFWKSGDALYQIVVCYIGVMTHYLYLKTEYRKGDWRIDNLRIFSFEKV